MSPDRDAYRARTLKRALVVLALLVPGGGHAGHGFMNSFADIEWLPNPGCTPDGFCYVLDTLFEHVVLLVAAVRGNELDPALRFAREKLAETAATLKAGDADAATAAAKRYLALAGRGGASVDGMTGERAAAARRRYVDALLEHVYIMTVEYVDFPLDVRARVLTHVFDVQMALFGSARDALPEREREALFFREEEIRWSLDMKAQADAQRITNDLAIEPVGGG